MIQISEKVEHQLFEKWLLCWGVDELLKYKEWTMLFINIPEDKITFEKKNLPHCSLEFRFDIIS